MIFGSPCPHDDCGGHLRVMRCNGEDCEDDIFYCHLCEYVSECSCGDSNSNLIAWYDQFRHEAECSECQEVLKTAGFKF